MVSQLLIKPAVASVRAVHIVLNQRLEVLRRPQGLAVQKQGLLIQQTALLELVGSVKDLGGVGEVGVESAHIGFARESSLNGQRCAELAAQGLEAGGIDSIAGDCLHDFKRLLVVPIWHRDAKEYF